MSQHLQKFKYPKRFQNLGENFWPGYSKLAEEYHPVDLGVGASDHPVPKNLSDALITVANDTGNTLLSQYARAKGHPRLVNALAKLYATVAGIDIAPLTDILITVGALAAMQAAVHGLIDDGDEVIVVEPFFESYDKLVHLSGGTPRYVPLRPTENATSAADWLLDPIELAAVFNERTKIIILNNPHNPVGKVYTRDELNMIADLCKKWDVICVSDEVYEWIVFDDSVHTRICTLPDMWERTITIGSAGKTFAVTGWSLGWAYGPADLLQYMHLFQSFTCATPLQEAVAVALEYEIKRLNTDDCYFKMLPIELQEKRDFMVTFLANANFIAYIPQGGCFLLANWTHLEQQIDFASENEQRGKDYQFWKWLVKNHGIQGIPPTIFYSGKHKALGEDYIRFCFQKNSDSLQKAANILANWQ